MTVVRQQLGAAGSPMNGWLAPALAYIVAMGAIGITSKLALAGMGWRELVLWSAVAYLIAAVGLLATGARFHSYELSVTVGGVITALIAPAALVLLLVALRHGDATRVIPATSTYPLVTVLLGVVLLRERISMTTVVGALAVVAGVVMLALPGDR